MNRFLPFLLLLIFCSCENFETRRVSSEEIFSAESRELNWQEVDQYPAFQECRQVLESQAAKKCFEKKVAHYFYAHLEAKQPVVTEVINDTLYLHLRISQEGVPQIDSIDVSPLIIEQLPDIREWLVQSVDSLPKIYPASKRGIPVVTTFKMPVVIKAE